MKCIRTFFPRPPFSSSLSVSLTTMRFEAPLDFEVDMLSTSGCPIASSSRNILGGSSIKEGDEAWYSPAGTI